MTDYPALQAPIPNCRRISHCCITVDAMAVLAFPYEVVHQTSVGSGSAVGAEPPQDFSPPGRCVLGLVGCVYRRLIGPPPRSLPPTQLPLLVTVKSPSEKITCLTNESLTPLSLTCRPHH
jgi:hypothetical protein